MKKFSIKNTLFYLGLFVLFVLITFPWQNLRNLIFRQIYQNTRVVVRSESMFPALLGWPGLSFKKVTVEVPFGNHSMEFKARALTTKAKILGLFPFIPGGSASIESLEKGGHLFVQAGMSETLLPFYAKIEGVTLSQIKLTGVPQVIDGSLSGEIDMQYHQSVLSESKGEIQLQVDQLKTNKQNFGWFVMPSIDLAGLDIFIPVEEGVARLEKFVFGTARSDIQGKITGQIKLGQDWLRSHLKLTLKLQLSEKLRNNPQAATLVSFLKSYESKNNPGHYGMKWDANLSEMRTNVNKSLPEAVN